MLRPPNGDSLVVEVLSLAVDLVLQREVEGDVLHLLLGEDLGAGGVLLLLQVLDHVGEPHGETVVAGGPDRGRRLQSETDAPRTGSSFCSLRCDD